MNPSDRLLRNLLTFQGVFYLAVNLWALLATRQFLDVNNPLGDVFEARSFAALSSILAIYFIVGAWRKDLLRPAAFLGLGSASAITLVELFHLFNIGWTYLWIDLIVEIALAIAYITLFFFWRGDEQKEEPKKEESADADTTAAVLPVTDEVESQDAPETATDASADGDGSSSDGGDGGGGGGSAD
jgi:hypothetical protein